MFILGFPTTDSGITLKPIFMFSKLSPVICLIVIVFLSSISACRKPEPGEPEAKKVFISNIVQLYAGINDPLNEGSTLVLAPGTYRLNPDFSKAGRLELQHNMSLIGQAGERQCRGY